MAWNPYREAGLPHLTADQDGYANRYGLTKGVVRAVYPDVRRVDVEPEHGGLLRKVLVIGDVLPEEHVDTDNPQHVLVGFIGGNMHDAVCWPLLWRRTFGTETTDDGKERHFYPKNQQIVRVKDLTVRITSDNRIYLVDAESDDYIEYDMNTRTVHTIAPHVFMGTNEATRYEYHRDTEVRIVIPKCLIGQTAVESADGMSYLAQQLIHLMSMLQVKATAGAEVELNAPLIELNAGSVVLNTTNSRFGGASAAEQLLLGNQWMTFYNTFITLFNAHTHTSVQNGPGTSGPPGAPAAAMDGSLLSDVARVSKAG